ncbi:hypothetical protein [Ktedonobacter racemifer]|uniref:Transposase IS4 family protein n=1 Tax=Ktedonobacter racemifer DSM 44963 TaxID=485913 RepID=D6TGX7_KTERA|nr:hypothetical protein [Ktedonobacter racemifer]EFH88906.1 hypothetical protein Krac_10416 [Ktedonobacter racemifer DSM 44963]
MRPVGRIAVRKRKPNGQRGIAVLISNLLPAEVEELSERPLTRSLDPAKDLLLASARLYGQRGGGVETSFKGDKQGLSLGKRNKKRFEAQHMVMLLATLAHNVLVWAQKWLAATASTVRRYGPLRLVREVFHISGFLLLDAWGRVRQIGLNQDAPLVPLLLSSLQSFVAPAHVAIYLAKT